MFLSTQRVTTNHQHNSQTDDINVFSIFLVFWITTINNNNCTTWKPEKFHRKFAIQTERIIKIKNNQKNKQTKQNS